MRYYEKGRSELAKMIEKLEREIKCILRTLALTLILGMNGRGSIKWYITA